MMPSLDMLLLKGPPNGDIPTGLADLRYQILSSGIPANNDGMVCNFLARIHDVHNQ